MRMKMPIRTMPKSAPKRERRASVPKMLRRKPLRRKPLRRKLLRSKLQRQREKAREKSDMIVSHTTLTNIYDRYYEHLLSLG